MSEGRDLEQQARKFLNLPELRAAWTSTQTTMFNILVEFGAALRAETPTREPSGALLIKKHACECETPYEGARLAGTPRVCERCNGLIRAQTRAETPAPRELQTLITRAKEFRHSVDEKGKFISDLDATIHLCKAVDAYEAAGEPEQAK